VHLVIEDLVLNKEGEREVEVEEDIEVTFLARVFIVAIDAKRDRVELYIFNNKDVEVQVVVSSAKEGREVDFDVLDIKDKEAEGGEEGINVKGEVVIDKLVVIHFVILDVNVKVIVVVVPDVEANVKSATALTSRENNLETADSYNTVVNVKVNVRAGTYIVSVDSKGAEAILVISKDVEREVQFVNKSREVEFSKDSIEVEFHDFDNKGRNAVFVI